MYRFTKTVYCIIDILFLAVLVAVTPGCESLLEKEPSDATPQTALTPVKQHVRTKRILALPCLDHSDYEQSDELTTAVTKRLLQALGSVPGVSAVEDQQLASAAAPYLTSRNNYNMSQLYQQASLKNIDGFIASHIDSVQIEQDPANAGWFSIKKARTIVNLRIELYDSRLQQLVYTQSKRQVLEERRAGIVGDGTPEVQKEQVLLSASQAVDAIRQELAAAIDRISWSGRIASIAWNRYYITGGLASGLRAGQLLRVFENPEPVTDPKTGVELGMPSGRFKGLLKIVELFGPDASTAVVHSGAGFLADDKVDLAPESKPLTF